MSFEWQEVTVGDISSLVTKGTTPTTLGFGFQDSGIRFVKVETLTEDGHFIEDKFAFISEDANKALLRSQLQEEDILFTIAGTIGRTGIVKKKHLPANTNQAVAIVRPNRSLIEPRYLRYVLSNPAFTRTAQSKTVQSVQANFSLGELKKAKFQLPPMAMQREILGVLGTLDDRITLLRETNSTLEAIAQALFKSWFVDFDPVHAKMQGLTPVGMIEATAALFPDSFEESELGAVPKGWEPKRLDSFIELAYGKALKSDTRCSGPVPVYGSGGVTGWHDKALVNEASVVVGRKGTVGSIYWESHPFFPIDTVFYVRASKPLTYCHQLLMTLGLNDMNTDAAVPGLNRENVYRLQVADVPSGVVEAFDDVVSALRRSIDRNNDQAQALSDIRDTLLPRLISGQLSSAIV